jgi:hypothetical protein
MDQDEIKALIERCKMALKERLDKGPKCPEIPNIKLQIENLKKRLKDDEAKK